MVEFWQEALDFRDVRCAVSFFFFQAEDGIRDSSVTGVQTCALPISSKVDVVIHSGEAGETVLTGTVAGVDRVTDLAVVRVPTKGLPPPLVVDSAHNLTELQKVYLFGFPFGKKLGSSITISEGSISAIRKDFAGTITQVQLMGDMQPGNSGGP